MPKISHAQQLRDWDNLLNHAREYQEEIPDLGLLLDELGVSRERYAELQAKRQHLRAEMLILSREMDEVRDDGKETAARARSYLRGKFGIHAEELVRYNMRPRRQYKKRKKAKEGKDKPSAEANPSPGPPNG